MLFSRRPRRRAAFGIEKWEALTCKENEDTPEVGEAPIVGLAPLATDPGPVHQGTRPEEWFTQAAGHPNFGITDFTLNTFPTLPGSTASRKASSKTSSSTPRKG